MPTNTIPVIDPNGQALMHALIEVGVDPEDAYNATQGVRKMSGEQVLLRLDAMEASTNARFDAMEASNSARFDAIEASIRALQESTRSLEESTRALETTTSVLAASTYARLDAIDAQLDLIGWVVMAAVAAVTALRGSKYFSSTRWGRRGKAPVTAAGPTGSERQTSDGPQ